MNTPNPMISNPPPPKAGQAQTHTPEWRKEFLKYWNAMPPIMIPDQDLQDRYEGAYSNGWLAGRFCESTGGANASGPISPSHSSLLASHERLKQALAGLLGSYDSVRSMDASPMTFDNINSAESAARTALSTAHSVNNG